MYVSCGKPRDEKFGQIWNFLQKKLKISLKVVKFFTGKPILAKNSVKFQKSEKKWKFHVSKKKRRHFFQNVSRGKPRGEKFVQNWKFL